MRIVLAELLDVRADALILGISDCSDGVAVRRHMRLDKRQQVAIINFHRLDGLKLILNVDSDRLRFLLGFGLELLNHVFINTGQAFELFSVKLKDRFQIFFLEFVVNLQFREVPIHRLESFGKFGKFFFAC